MIVTVTIDGMMDGLYINILNNLIYLIINKFDITSHYWFRFFCINNLSNKNGKIRAAGAPMCL